MLRPLETLPLKRWVSAQSTSAAMNAGKSVEGGVGASPGPAAESESNSLQWAANACGVTEHGGHGQDSTKPQNYFGMYLGMSGSSTENLRRAVWQAVRNVRNAARLSVLSHPEARAAD